MLSDQKTVNTALAPLRNFFANLQKDEFKVNDSVSVSSINPFAHLTSLFGEVVTYRGNVYVPSVVATPVHFQSFQSGGKKSYLKSVGSVATQIVVPKFVPGVNRAREIVDEALHYYTCPEKTVVDLLRFRDEKYRKQYLVEFFSKPHYFTKDSVACAQNLGSQSKAILRSSSDTIAFGDDLEHKQKVTDALSTRFPQVTLLSKYDTKRPIWYDFNTDANKSTASIYIGIPEHRIKTNLMTYNFPATTLVTNLTFSKFGLNLSDYPKPANGPYPHFFVFERSNEICYDGTSRFEKIGLETGKFYDVKNNDLGYKLARVVEQGLVNLTEGYKPGCNPARLESSLSAFAYSNIFRLGAK